MLHLMIRGVRKRAKFSLSIVPMPVLALAVLVLLAVGCATPVGVTQLGLQAGYRLQTESALSAGQASEPSKMVLRRLGLLDQFEKQPGPGSRRTASRIKKTPKECVRESFISSRIRIF